MRGSVLSIVTALVLVHSAPAQIFKPSMKDQVKLGTDAANEIKKKNKALPDSDPRVQLIRSIGKRLVATIPAKELSDRPWLYSFDVIRDKEVNAFALPGGPTFFLTGLLSKLKTEDEIAGVLAHEITHVRKEHWAKDYAKSQESSLGILVLGTILKANDTAFKVASLADVLGAELPRSRKHESEADSVGFGMVIDAGFNPQGMIDVFKLLNTISTDKPPEFMSTHPDDKKRIKALEDRLAKEKRSLPPQKPLDPKIRALAVADRVPVGPSR